MKFELKKAKEFDWKGLKEWGWRGIRGWEYNSKDDFPRANATVFEMTGRHGKVKSLVSDRIYLVLRGKGEFTIAGEIFPVEKDDVIIVPKNTPYDYKAVEGTLEMFLVNTPAFDRDKEVKLE